jgi:hypothetical protein
MTTPQQYAPGPANLTRVQKDGENWTLVLVRQLSQEGRKGICCISLEQSNRRLVPRAWRNMCRGY